MSNSVINKIVNNFEDYFFLVEVYHEHNTTGELELHDLNSDGPIALGEEAVEKYLVNFLEWYNSNLDEEEKVII